MLKKNMEEIEKECESSRPDDTSSGAYGHSQRLLLRSKGCSRQTVSTNSSMSPTNLTKTESPTAPSTLPQTPDHFESALPKFLSKSSQPGETTPLQEEGGGGTPWPPGFLQENKDPCMSNSSSHQRLSQAVLTEKLFFRNTIPKKDRIPSPPHSPREPMSPTSPVLKTNPWNSEPASPITQSDDPWQHVVENAAARYDDGMISPPMSPPVSVPVSPRILSKPSMWTPSSAKPSSDLGDIPIPWTPEIMVSDPWAACENNNGFKHASTRGWLKVVFWVIAVAISTAPIHWFDIRLVLDMTSRLEFQDGLFASGLMAIICAYEFCGTRCAGDANATTPTVTRRYFATALGFLEGLLRFYHLQTFWQGIVSRVSTMLNAVITATHIDNIVQTLSAVSSDIQHAEETLDLIMQPGRYSLELPCQQMVGPEDENTTEDDNTTEHDKHTEELHDALVQEEEEEDAAVAVVPKDVQGVQKGGGVSVSHLPTNYKDKPSRPKIKIKGGQYSYDSVVKTFSAKHSCENGFMRSSSSTWSSHFQPSSHIVFPKGCQVTHITSGGRFEVLHVIEDLAEVESFLQLRNVKTGEKVIHPTGQFKKIANENLEPRSVLLEKLEDARKDGMDSRAHLHLGAHFAVLSQLAYADLPTDHGDAKRKGNLIDKVFGDLGGCAEFLEYNRDVEVYYVDDQSLQAVKFENENEIVIVVRGTVPEPLAKGTWFGPNIDTDKDCQPAFHRRYGFMHGGFWHAARNLWCRTDLPQFLGDHRKKSATPKRVYFVGHSLGASVVMFLARFCRDDPSVNYPADRLEIHTFGCGPVFYVARTLKFHQQFSEGKDSADVASMRVNLKLHDWDPNKKREPEKIHHERWVKEYDVVPQLYGGTMYSGVWKLTFWTQYSNFFISHHVDEPNSLPGPGHGAMAYYEEIRKQISRSPLSTDRSSGELRASIASLIDYPGSPTKRSRRRGKKKSRNIELGSKKPHRKGFD